MSRALSPTKGERDVTTTQPGGNPADSANFGFDRETFQEFISFDVGDGPPIFWHSVGKLYRHPEGEVIAGVEALVSNRLVSREDTRAEAICRTLLLYRDAESGEILQEADGSHILREYPYIVARFEFQEHRMSIAAPDHRQVEPAHDLCLVPAQGLVARAAAKLGLGDLRRAHPLLPLCSLARAALAEGP